MKNNFEITLHAPGNETIEHFMLKQVALVFLWMENCRVNGLEIPIGEYQSGEAPHIKGLPKKCTNHYISDAVGVTKNNRVICVEAKVSVSDYKNGFCVHGDKNYIISPKGLLKQEMVPNEIGLIEVNMENGLYTIERKGILLKRPTRDKKEFAQYITRNIACKSTIKATFNNEWIASYWKNTPLLLGG